MGGGWWVLAVVAPAVVGAAEEADGGAGADVGEEGEGDEEGLGEGCLVDLAGEEQVGFGGEDGARGEGDDGGCGEVEGAEDGEGVGGVALDAGYWGGGRLVWLSRRVT